jgi:GntR family transcriptional regulator
MPESGGLRKYEQLRRRLQADIDTLKPHAPLPTERDLAATYEVSRTTVRQALDTLEDAGAIYRVQGAGTFVASPIISKSLTLTGFSEDMTARGLQPSSQLLAVDLLPAGRQLADQLQIAERDEVIRINRLRRADDSPMCLESVHLPGRRVPGLLDVDQLNSPFTGSLYALLERAYGLRVVRAELSGASRVRGSRGPGVVWWCGRRGRIPPLYVASSAVPPGGFWTRLARAGLTRT